MDGKDDHAILQLVLNLSCGQTTDYSVYYTSKLILTSIEKKS